MQEKKIFSSPVLFQTCFVEQIFPYIKKKKSFFSCHSCIKKIPYFYTSNLFS